MLEEHFLDCLSGASVREHECFPEHFAGVIKVCLSYSRATTDVAPKSKKAYRRAFLVANLHANAPLPCWWVGHLQLLSWPFLSWCGIPEHVLPIL
jgi:hypothetical protein